MTVVFKTYEVPILPEITVFRNWMDLRTVEVSIPEVMTEAAINTTAFILARIYFEKHGVGMDDLYRARNENNPLLLELAESFVECAIESFVQNEMKFDVESRYYKTIDEMEEAIDEGNEMDYVLNPYFSYFTAFIILYELNPKYAKKKLKRIRDIDTSLWKLCWEGINVIDAVGGLRTPEKLRNALFLLEKRI